MGRVAGASGWAVLSGWWKRSSAPGTVVVGEGLIEGIEVGAGWCSALGFSFPLGCLVEIDLRLWRSESWGPMGEGEVSEDAFDDGGVGEEGEDAQGARAGRSVPSPWEGEGVVPRASIFSSSWSGRP